MNGEISRFAVTSECISRRGNSGHYRGGGPSTRIILNVMFNRIFGLVVKWAHCRAKVHGAIHIGAIYQKWEWVCFSGRIRI